MSLAIRVLVTGFEPFAQHRHNASEAIARALSGCSAVHAEVLPTSYDRASTRLEGLIVQLKPDAVLMLGLAGDARALRLERFALNRDTAELPDNDGVRRLAGAIVAGAAERCESTLPLEQFAHRVRALGCPVEFSDCAGGFVCNHVFYRIQHWIAKSRLPIRCGFLHVPPAAAVSLEPWLGAVRACVDVLRADTGRPYES